MRGWFRRPPRAVRPTVHELTTATGDKYVAREMETATRAKDTSAPPVRTVSGSEAVVLSLIDQGVEVIFGYPGGAIMPVYDALYEHDHELPSHPGPARTGFGSRRPRLHPCVRKAGRMYRDFGSRSDEPDYRTRRRKNGLHGGGLYHGAGAVEVSGRRCVPGNGHHLGEYPGHEVELSDYAARKRFPRSLPRRFTSRRRVATGRY